MRTTWGTVALLSLALLGACDHPSRISMSTPAPDALRLAMPDSSFTLSAAERAKVLPTFDADALERLLRMIRPDMRAEVLRHFQVREKNGERLGHLAQFYDPVLQEVLEEVWARAWEDEPDEALIEDWYGFPGRELALKRRQAHQDLP